MNLISAKKQLINYAKENNIKLNIILDTDDMFLISIDGKDKNSIGIRIDDAISIWGYEEDVSNPLTDKSLTECLLLIDKYIKSGFSISFFDAEDKFIYGTQFLLNFKPRKEDAKIICDDFADKMKFIYATALMTSFDGDFEFKINLNSKTLTNK